MNRATLEKIQKILDTIDGLDKTIALDDSYTVGVSYQSKGEGRDHYISSSANMERIRPILITYRDQLRQELNNLGFEET